MRKRAILFFVLSSAVVGAAEGANPVTSGASPYSFSDFRLEQPFSGRTMFPDFEGRDKAFRSYRTRIKEGLSRGPNFASGFSVIQIGCGSGCSFLFIASNATGRVFDFPRGDKNPSLQAYFEPDSSLFIVQWQAYDTDQCFLEYFDWSGSAAKLLTTRPIGDLEACGRDVRENVSP